VQHNTTQHNATQQHDAQRWNPSEKKEKGPGSELKRPGRYLIGEMTGLSEDSFLSADAAPSRKLKLPAPADDDALVGLMKRATIGISIIGEGIGDAENGFAGGAADGTALKLSKSILQCNTTTQHRASVSKRARGREREPYL
jgi:hypothetical protein